MLGRRLCPLKVSKWICRLSKSLASLVVLKSAAIWPILTVEAPGAKRLERLGAAVLICGLVEAVVVCARFSLSRAFAFAPLFCVLTGVLTFLMGVTGLLARLVLHPRGCFACLNFQPCDLSSFVFMSAARRQPPRLA